MKLAKRGKEEMVGCCPFHADDTPSLSVNAAKNLFNCFGCGASGGPIDWVMKREGVSFRHAVELLRDGVVSEPDRSPSAAVTRSTVRKLDAPVSFGADDQALLDQVIGYYHETMKSAPEGQAYGRKVRRDLRPGTPLHLYLPGPHRG
ncbi:MAG: CHC2 zinc finger domain-containing protein, partial [Sphingopyxis sp.]|uniref:CHC2 zinc finger domain-containing protein n=1 Tax=Sphingopyxis sp. TaxID=1908224 RepID=UPI0040358600